MVLGGGGPTSQGELVDGPGPYQLASEIWLPSVGVAPPGMPGGAAPRSMAGVPAITGIVHMAGLSVSRFSSTVPTLIVIDNSAGGIRMSTTSGRAAPVSG